MLYLYLIISLGADILITKYWHLLNTFGDIWKPALVFFGVFLIVILVHVLILASLSAFSKDEGKIKPSTRGFAILTLNLLMPILGVKLHTTGFENVPKDEKFLVVCNHISHFDPLISLYAFREHRVGFVSKKENMSVPVIGGLLRNIGCLSLDRDNDRSAVKTILTAAKIVKNGDYSIGIYPEGGTNRTKEPLMTFRNGAFKIAQRSNAPVVVTTISGADKIMKNIPFRRTNVYVDVIKTIPYESFADKQTNELGAIVYDLMLENIIKRREA